MEFLPEFANARPTSTKAWFSLCTKLSEIRGLEYLNTSQVTTMRDMFSECRSLTSVDVSGFDTQNVTNMFSMFYGCKGLTSLDLSSFKTNNVTTMYGMLHGCTNLKDLNLGNMNTSAVTSMTRLFYNCSSLEVLDLSSFNTANVTEIGEMFYKCSSLKTIYASEDFVTAGLGSGDTNSKNMFQYCNAIVGGNGTTYQGDNFEYHTYARIDGTDDKKGYFTSIYDLGYTVYDAANRTMTFYGDKNRDEHTEGTTYGLNDDWYLDLHFDVNKVVFDPTFANARPQSMYEWFTDFVALTTVEGWENLNTSRTTNMQDLFYACRNLTTLDLSHFDMSKNNVSIYAGRVYFLLPTAEAAGKESLFVLFGDEIPTDISRTECDEITDDNSW